MQQPIRNISTGVTGGVKVISVLYYIIADLSLIFAIMFFVGVGVLSTVLGSVAPFLGELGTGLVVVVGIVSLILAVLYFFIARGLWKAQKWARIVLIIFSILGIISAISTLVSGSLTQGILNIVINGVIGGYLIFSKKVKTAFS